MRKVKTSIIPQKQTFVNIKSEKHDLDLRAICVFMATGFFLDTDTYWKDQKVLAPASINMIDEENNLVSTEKWFNWSYNPNQNNFNSNLEEFSSLFEDILLEQTKHKKVILPLSGGLDSRTQALGLKKIGADVQAYSYSFENGFKESKISKQIAKECGYNFNEYTIPKSYLWDSIDELAKINSCYSEFTHPRQMAVMQSVSTLGNTFSLGHWGDVLFDSFEIHKTIDLNDYVISRITKEGGLEIAEDLWETWQLEGSFKDYLYDRIKTLINKIEIENRSAKFRAFKSLYWAPRWTSINLSIFEKFNEITLPYYHDNMCKFICNINEKDLNNRKIQIEYIKNNNKSLASIIWQEKKPFNLNNYNWAKPPFNYPYRFYNKILREYQNILGEKFVQRNWELQFLGAYNSKQLNSKLNNNDFHSLVPKELISRYLNNFYSVDNKHYSHSISMLLTLRYFLKNKE